MSKPGFSWLIVGLLGSLALSGRAGAQASEGTLTLELLQRIEQLELEVRHIRGELELYRYQLEGLQRERAVAPPAALPPSAAASEPAAAPEPAPPPATTPPAPDAQTPPTAPGADQADFDQALGELRAGSHAQAIADFQGFLSAYPNSPLAGDAQYWLGESYAASENYQAAKEALIQLGLHYPQSQRLPEALLKLSEIYGKLGDPIRAKEVLEKLIQVYPDSPAANLAGQRLQSLP